MTRATGTVRNVRLAASFVVGALRTDPSWLVLQASRRLPARLSAVVVPVVERVPGLAGRGGAARLRALWDAGDVTALRTTVPATRRERRVRDRLLVPLATLAPHEPAADAPPRRTAASGAVAGTLAVHHHLTGSLPHTQSGYTLRTHAVLRARRAAGDQVTATTRAGYPVTIGALTARPVDVVDGVRYERLVPRALPPDAARRRDDEVRLLTDAVRRAGADVVHATTPWTTGQAARDAAARLGLPWVYEVRGLPEETWAASRPTPGQRDAAAASERFALIRAKETELALAADHVVTLSATMRDELVDRGVPPGRITVVPNAVDATLLDTAAPAPDRVRARLGLGVRPLVGAVTSAVGYEGLDTVLRTVARLRADGLDVGALVVGDGVARPDLVRLAADLGIAEHVALPGRLPRDVARRYLTALDVVLVPRRDDRVTRLVTPLKPVEAMALGRPVVASDLPALAEVCSPLDGGAPAATLVAADDVEGWAAAVARLLHDEGARRTLVAAGREVAAGRTWTRVARRYDDVYAAARHAHRDPAGT